jgi:hypothetical protein
VHDFTSLCAFPVTAPFLSGYEQDSTGAGRILSKLGSNEKRPPEVILLAGVFC